MSMKARVLDYLFPVDILPIPYARKLILRFGDSDTQITLLVYPGAKSEAIVYSVAGMNRGDLQQYIAAARARNPQATAQDIAAGLKTDNRRTPIDYSVLEPVLKELQSITISPALAARIAVDDFSEFEFWYDTWQESVHYNLVGPAGGAPQDGLVQWMLKTRSVVEASLASKARP